MKKEILIRGTALVLVLVLLLSCLGGVVFAAEPTADGGEAAEVTPMMTLMVAAGALAVVGIAGLVMLIRGRFKK